MAREISALRNLQAPVAAPADFQIVVPHRDGRLTKAALQYAATLTNGLNVRLRLIDVHVVPYGVPIDKPTVSPKHVERKLKALVQECAFQYPPEVAPGTGSRDSDGVVRHLSCCSRLSGQWRVFVKEMGQQTKEIWPPGHLGGG
jgi:hypothetical protein